MADENDEERKYYTLKPKSFERVNPPTQQEPQGAIDVQAMLQQNLAADAGSKRAAPAESTSSAQTTSTLGSVGSPPPLPTSISARGDGVPPVLPVARVGSRRTKDFWITIACAGCALAVPAFFFRQSELALIGLASGFVLFTVLMAWIFLGIMDRY